MQVNSNKGPHPFPRRDINEIAKRQYSSSEPQGYF